jgi:hypothetical protein
MFTFKISILKIVSGNLANFYIQNLLALLCSAILLSGCSKHNLQMAKEFEQIPELITSNDLCK